MVSLFRLHKDNIILSSQTKMETKQSPTEIENKNILLSVKPLLRSVHVATSQNPLLEFFGGVC